MPFLCHPPVNVPIVNDERLRSIAPTCTGIVHRRRDLGCCAVPKSMLFRPLPAFSFASPHKIAPEVLRQPLLRHRRGIQTILMLLPQNQRSFSIILDTCLSFGR
jgi:hypothetical protein